MKTLMNLSNIETWIFDLDNTLYHSSLNLFSQIDKRMSAYVADFLGVSRSEAYKIQMIDRRNHSTLEKVLQRIIYGPICLILLICY